MGIDFYDRMWEEEQKEKERFGQRKNEIENELFEQRRKIENLEKENEELKEQNKIILEDNDELNHWNDELREQIERISITNFGVIEKLKAQIEKMKCCTNCIHKFEPRKKGGHIMPCEATEYKPCNRWELAD